MLRRVLLIGDIQSGKSSLIKDIYRYSGQKSPDTLKIGCGSVRETTCITTYSIPNLKPQYYKLTPDSEGLNDIEISYRIIEKLITVSKNPIITDEWNLNLEVIDTPGLNVSDNEDEITINKLREVTVKGNVDSIFIVMRATDPLGTNRRNKLKEIISRFPEYKERFNFINLISAREDLTDDIRNGRTKLQQEILHNSNLPLFVENAFCRMTDDLKYFSCEGIRKLLEVIRSS